MHNRWTGCAGTNRTITMRCVVCAALCLGSQHRNVFGSPVNVRSLIQFDAYTHSTLSSRPACTCILAADVYALVWHTKWMRWRFCVGILAFSLLAFTDPSTIHMWERRGNNAAFCFGTFKHSNEHKAEWNARQYFGLCASVCASMECFVRQTKISADSWKGEFNVNVRQRRSKLDCVEWEIWQQWNWFRMVFGECLCVDVDARC